MFIEWGTPLIHLPEGGSPHPHITVQKRRAVIHVQMRASGKHMRTRQHKPHITSTGAHIENGTVGSSAAEAQPRKKHPLTWKLR